MANVQLEIPPWLRYTCQSTGLCCRRGLDIWGVDKDRERLEKQNWAMQLPQLAEGDLFLPRDRGFRIATDPSGACRFLTADNRCHMHTKIGYKHKLLACRMFPFNLVHSAGRVYVSLLFSCPTVLDNIGTPLTEQTPQITKLLRDMDDVYPPLDSREETSLDGRRMIRFRDVRFFEETMVAILRDAEIPFLRRVLWAGSIVDRLEEATKAQVAPDTFYETLCHHRDRAKDEAINSGVQKPRLGIFERMLLRQLQGVGNAMADTGLASGDAKIRRAARFQRIGTALRYLRGSGALPANLKRWHITHGRPDDATAERVFFAEVNAVRSLRLPAESEELLGRYLATRFWGRTSFGHEFWGLPVLHGARGILALSALVVWHAKVFAALAKRSEIAPDDVRGGVLAVDHVFGHFTNLGMAITRNTLQAVNRQAWPQRALLYTML